METRFPQVFFECEEAMGIINRNEEETADKVGQFLDVVYLSYHITSERQYYIKTCTMRMASKKRS